MPVIFISIACFTGVLAADRLGWSLSIWLWVGLGCLLLPALLLLPVKRRLFPAGGAVPALAAGCLLAFTLGAARYQGALPDLENPDYVAHFSEQDGPVAISGVVVGYPDSRDQITNLRLRVDAISSPQQEEPSPCFGLILAKIAVEESVHYGDRVQVSGYLELPPEEEDFNYRAYLKRQNIYAYLPQAEILVMESGQGNPFLRLIYSLRSRGLEAIYRLWPDPEASLLAGILLGLESGISEGVQQAFRETGTTHVIAISGFNITIVAGLFTRFFGRLLNPRRAAAAALAGIGFYTLLVGADAAVVRAAVMGGLSILAGQIGRRQHGLNAAALASLIMLLINPQLPWDISFQLSLSATLGLILYADPMAAWFLRASSRVMHHETARRIAGPISEYVLFTFAAQLTTLPVMLYHFRSFSLITFLTNPAILPVQPPIMLVGGLALILGMIWLPLGRAAAPLVFPFVFYTIRVVEWFSSLPLGSIAVGPIPLAWVGVFYLLLGTLTFGGPLLAALKARLVMASLAAGLAAALVLAWRMVYSGPDGLLHFVLLDVGTGSALYLQTPSGQRLLINGGPSTRQLSDLLGRRLPPFQRRLDYLIIASPTAQDIDALAGNLPRFQPRAVLWLGEDDLCWEAENLRVVLDENSIPVDMGKTGQTLMLSDGVRITVLDQSRRGGTLLVEYGNFQGLLPFGLLDGTIQEWRNGRDLGEVSSFLLADNGYQSSNPSAWIHNLNPGIVLLSLGIEDSRGLPDRGLLDRLAGYSLLRTDQHGTIHLTSDGEHLWIRVDSWH
jgi:competence protein ComEC